MCENNKPMERLALCTGYESAYQGTHIIVLPCDEYLKKYWNKIGYVKRNSDNSYSLFDASCYGNSKKVRLSKAWNNAPTFFSNAIEGVHFEWIEDSTIFDKNGKEIMKSIQI